MGYGISRTTHANRLWSLPVAFTIADGIGGAARGNIALAISAWTNQLFVQAGSVPDVQPRLEIKPTSGSTLWRSGDGLQGRSPNPQPPYGLFVKDDSRVCSIIHELGHALGLTHEQDRPDGAIYRATLKNKGPREEQIAETSSKDMAQGGKGYVAYGDFDYESIMIYPTPDRMSPSFGDFKAIEAIYNISIIAIGPKKLSAALGQLQSTAALAAAGSRAAAATDKLRSIGSIAHKG